MKRNKISDNNTASLAGDTALASQKLPDVEVLHFEQTECLDKVAFEEESKRRKQKLYGIATRIADCRHEEPYWRSPVCAPCARKFQKWFAWTAPVAARRAAQSNNPADVLFLSLPLPQRLDQGAPPPLIKQFASEVLRDTRRALIEAGVTFLVGAFDVRVLRRGSIQPILFAAGVATELRKAEAAIHAAFDANDEQEPVLSEYDGNVASFAHAVGTPFESLISDEPDAQLPEFERMIARVERPTWTELAETALFFDALGGSGRLFLLGCEVRTNTKGRNVIRPTEEAMARLAEQRELPAATRVARHETGAPKLAKLIRGKAKQGRLTWRLSSKV